HGDRRFSIRSLGDRGADLVAIREVQAHLNAVLDVLRDAEGQVELAVLTVVRDAVPVLAGAHQAGRIALDAVHPDVEEAGEVVLVGGERALSTVGKDLRGEGLRIAAAETRPRRDA